MACGVSCVKYLVFLFNLLFALTGLAILTVGAYIQINFNHYSQFVGESVWTAPIILIVVGAVVFVIAFLGCFGAVTESSRMVLTFSVLLVIIFLLEVGVGIAGYIKHSQLNDILSKGFNDSINEYNTNKESQMAWKLIQTELKCCGVNGPADWNQMVFHNSTIPESCCTIKPENQSCNLQYANKDGCLNKLLNLLDSNSLLLAGVGIGIALVQLIGVCYACCLYRAFRKQYETV